MPPEVARSGWITETAPASSRGRKALFQVDVLASADGRAHRLLELTPLRGQLPGDHVLVPGQRELIERLPQPDAGFDVELPEVIGRQRYLVADDRARLPRILHQTLDADIGELDAGERVHDITPLQRARRGRYRAFDAVQQADADVHLQELEAGLHPPFQPLAHRLPVGDRVGIAVNQDLVAEFAAGQLISRDAVSLARQVEERHFDAADAAALPPVIAELLDLAEEPVDIAGVLAQQARFEHERVRRAGAIAHFAIAADALIGIQPQQRRVEGQRLEIDDAQVGDFQVARARAGVDLGFEGLVESYHHSQFDCLPGRANNSSVRAVNS